MKKKENQKYAFNVRSNKIIQYKLHFFIFQLKNTKKNHKKIDASFSKLVNKYKTKISAPETLKKWYET